MIYRNHLFDESQFSERAQHAAGFHAPQLAGFYLDAALLLRLSVERSRYPASVKGDGNVCSLEHVGRSCNYLHRFLFAYVELAYHQLVGIRMLFYL